jgi:hypothetical protein
VSVEMGDTVVATALLSDPDGTGEVREGTRGQVVGFAGNDPVVDFGDAGDVWLVFPVDPEKVEAIRRLPTKGRRR